MTDQQPNRSFRKAGAIVQERLDKGDVGFSFEYYPPKTQKGIDALKKRFGKMWGWGADWMDITWGAGGLTSELTVELASELAKRNMNPMMHLTCTNMEKEKVDKALKFCSMQGICNILALRGDPPVGQTEWKAIDSGFSCALDLVKYIKENYDDRFSITVAGYPEGHPTVRNPITDPKWDPVKNVPKYWAPYKNKEGVWEGVSPEDWKNELAYLKDKVDAGGELITTQLFYDVDIFLAFVEEAKKVGINVPILPGLMPIRNYGGFHRMTGFCNTVIPPVLAKAVELLKDDTDKLAEFGVTWIVEMMKKIFKSGAIASIHIYTMNTDQLPRQILEQLGMGNYEVTE